MARSARRTTPMPIPKLPNSDGGAPERRRLAQPAKIKALAALSLGVLILLLAGCASEHPLDSLTADAGPSSERITNLFWPILIVAIIILILVEGAIIYMIRRWWEFQYHTDGNTDSPPDFVTAGELVIPVGQQVPLEITSRDVIHSYWIPQLIGKKDGVPGRYHDWLIEASRPGRYLGACTEFCGLAHGYMRMYTIALPATDWNDWAANQRQPVTPLNPGEVGYEGQELFLANCARCHSISGLTDTNGDDQTDDPSIYSGGDPVHDQLVAGAAPDLTHMMSRATFAGATYNLYEDRGEDVDYQDLAQLGEFNAAELENWISNAPGNKPGDWEAGRGMPPFPNLTNADVDALVEYLRTLT